MVHILSNIFGSSKTKLCLYKTDNMDIGKSTICKAIGASFSTKAMHFIRFNWVTVECSKMLQWQSTSISTLVIWYRRVVRLIPIRYALYSHYFISSRIETQIFSCLSRISSCYGILCIGLLIYKRLNTTWWNHAYWTKIAL